LKKQALSRSWTNANHRVQTLISATFWPHILGLESSWSCLDFMHVILQSDWLSLSQKMSSPILIEIALAWVPLIVADIKFLASATFFRFRLCSCMPSCYEYEVNYFLDLHSRSVFLASCIQDVVIFERLCLC